MIICGLVIFFNVHLVFYGINFAMGGIGLSLYINAIVVASFETLSYAVNGTVNIYNRSSYNRFTEKKSYILWILFWFYDLLYLCLNRGAKK